MTRAIIFDFSKVLLFPKDPEYSGSLNGLNAKLIEEHGEDYPFFDHFRVNDELLEFMASLNCETDVYIFTTDSIQDRSELKILLKGKIKDIFKAGDLGIAKNTGEAYQIIAQKIGAETHELIYVDDMLENVNAADSVGVRAFLYLNNSDVIRNISRLF